MLAIAGRFFNRTIEAVLSPFSRWSRDPSQLDTSAKLLLQKVLFAANGHIPKLGAPALSGHSIGSAFMVSDYTFAYRSIHDLLSSCGVGGWFSAKFGGTDAALVYQATGFASGLGAFVGAVQMQRAFENIAVSSAIADKRGLLLGRVSVLKDAAYIGGALGLTGFRAIAIFDAIKNIAPSPSSASLAGRATYGIMIVGLVLYTLFFALLGVISGIKIYEGAKLKNKLKGKELSEQIAILQRQLKADPEAILAKLQKKLGTDTARQKLIDLASKTGTDQLRTWLKELNIPEVSDEKLADMVKQVVDNQDQLMAFGLEMMTQSVQVKKLAKMGRILNKEGMEALKELSALTENSKGAELVEAIQKGANKKLVENSILTAIFVFGVITLVAAMVFSGGTALIVASVLMLLFTIMAIGLDGYYLAQSYKEEQPAQHDKRMLLISSAVAVASALTIAALVASGVVTMGVVPLIAGLIVTLIWLGQNGITLAIMNRNEKLFQEKNPTLEVFIQALKEERDDLRLKRMLENLPAEIKKEINGELNRQMMLAKAIAMTRKVEEAKKKGLEELRKALAPLLIQ